MPTTRPWQHWFVIATVSVLVGLYDLWAVRAASGERFAWGKDDLFGYYNLLARAFASGQLSLPVLPSPQLLALPNPWDPGVDPALKMHDVALYNGRYYLYYGVAPALLLFTPYRLVTGQDLPQNFAVFLLAFGGSLLMGAALLRVLRLAGLQPGPALTGGVLLALGFCPGIPFLLNRVDVYEVAIACGYFCMASGLYSLARAFATAAKTRCLLLSGLCFGLAVASRPHLLFAGLTAGLLVSVHRRKYPAVPYWAGLLAIGAVIGSYNYARFGNPLEFGLRYHLGGPGQNRIELAPQNWLPGIYYFLLAPPDFSPVFPWLRLRSRFPFDSAHQYPLPENYFREPIAGALWVCPLIVFALLIPLLPRGAAKQLLSVAAGGGALTLLFLVSNHFATHRYLVDFLPLLSWAALAVLCLHTATKAKAVATGLLCVLIPYTIVANLAFGIAGPYFDLLQNRPRSFVRLASWFSPTAETRPSINPAIHVRFQVSFTPHPPGYREPLLVIGDGPHSYYLYVDRPDNRMHFYSQYRADLQEYAMGLPGPGPHEIEFAYGPETQRVQVTIDGQPAFTQSAALLVTAPAGVTVGANFADTAVANYRFPGRVVLLERQVSPAGLPTGLSH